MATTGGGGYGAYNGLGRSGSSASRSRSRSIPHSESFSTTDPAKLTDSELDCLKVSPPELEFDMS